MIGKQKCSRKKDVIFRTGLICNPRVKLKAFTATPVYLEAYSVFEDNWVFFCAKRGSTCGGTAEKRRC